MKAFARVLSALWLGGMMGDREVRAEGSEPFVIEVRDLSANRNVPLARLRTVHGVEYVTDNGGVVAILEPELMGREVFFHVSSDGYRYPEDGFGFRGIRLKVEPGGHQQVSLERVHRAERLYRVTGAGLYDHSVVAGRDTPLREPLLNAKVLGSDSVQNAIWKGKLFWIWGDTNRLAYPLGNFQVTAAVSELPEKGGLAPHRGVDLDYFVDPEKGFVKKVAPLPGEGPTWLSGLVVLPDEEGKEHLLAHFVKVKGFLDVYRSGLCEWDEETEEFREVLVFPEVDAPAPSGHAFLETIDGDSQVVFADPLPRLRMPATYEAWKDPSTYEVLETKSEFVDSDSGREVKPHRGSVAWNPYRGRWTMIFCEQGGESSHLGEIWYAEADASSGPWKHCLQVVTHDRYSFYNPKQHPYFSGPGEKYLYFEGTYTAMFSKAPRKTPKYDYNQIMYRLDLDRMAEEWEERFGEAEGG